MTEEGPQKTRKRKKCVHGRRPHTCGHCNGASICVHGTRREICRDCEGSLICEHGRQRHHCPFCRPKGVYKDYAAKEIRRYGALPENFMSFECYSELIKQNCNWCGRSPIAANGMGIDRRNNDLGHVEGNIEPCCGPCNRARGVMEYEVFSHYILDLLYGRQEETYE